MKECGETLSPITGGASASDMASPPVSPKFFEVLGLHRA